MRFSAGDAMGMERRMMENDGSLFLPEPLFVRPVRLRYSSETMRGAARMPMKARDLLMEGYAKMQAKDFDGADAAFRQASALTPSPQVLEAQARLLVARGDPKGALRLLDTFPQRAIPLYWLRSEIQSSLGEHKAAIASAEQAAKLAGPSGETSIDYAASLNNLGVALQLSGDAKQALQLYEQSVTALQAAAEKAPPTSASPSGSSATPSARRMPTASRSTSARTPRTPTRASSPSARSSPRRRPPRSSCTRCSPWTRRTLACRRSSSARARCSSAARACRPRSAATRPRRSPSPAPSAACSRARRRA
jgi:tetratricopeptide (TPR) repeat protein